MSGEEPSESEELVKVENITNDLPLTIYKFLTASLYLKVIL